VLANAFEISDFLFVEAKPSFSSDVNRISRPAPYQVLLESMSEAATKNNGRAP